MVAGWSVECGTLKSPFFDTTGTPAAVVLVLKYA